MQQNLREGNFKPPENLPKSCTCTKNATYHTELLALRYSSSGFNRFYWVCWIRRHLKLTKRARQTQSTLCLHTQLGNVFGSQ